MENQPGIEREFLPHQQRVVDEFKELADKHTKLGQFIGGDMYQSLHNDEKVRLNMQEFYMGAYLQVLNDRIAAF